MATIPQEIIHDIFLSLPPKSIVRFKSVCKAWKRHFESSDFIQKHLSRSHQLEWDHSSLILTCGSSLYVIDDLNDNPSSRPRELTLPRSFHHNNGTIKVVGSCNGLLCIASGRGSNHYFLCNPSSSPRSFKILPFAHNRLSEEVWRLNPWSSTKIDVISGFGYDHIGDDYKIVYGWFQENYYFGQNYFSEVLLYSSITGSWKSIGIPEFGMGWHNDSVFFNNHLHWIISEHKVVCIDLHDEQWSEIDLPDCWLNCSVQDICVVGGCFGAIVSERGETELWVMREYNVKESWESLFTLPNITSHVLYYSTRRHQALVDDVHHLDQGWYSPQEKKIVQWVEIPKEFEISRVKSFVGSLVPVLTKRSGKEHKDEGNAQESKVEETETDEIGGSSSIRTKGRIRRKKRNQFN